MLSLQQIAECQALAQQKQSVSLAKPRRDACSQPSMTQVSLLGDVFWTLDSSRAFRAGLPLHLCCRYTVSLQLGKKGSRYTKTQGSLGYHLAWHHCPLWRQSMRFKPTALNVWMKGPTYRYTIRQTAQLTSLWNKVKLIQETLKRERPISRQ